MVFINHWEKFNAQFQSALLNVNFRIMMFWKSCLFNLAFTSAFEINVLHKPQIHKSFGEGSYVFNQPLYQHGLEGKQTKPKYINRRWSCKDIFISNCHQDWIILFHISHIQHSNQCIDLICELPLLYAYSWSK